MRPGNHLLTGLALVSVLALGGWIFYDDTYEGARVKRSDLTQAEQQYIGTANSLSLTLQFFMFGEQRMPKDWDEFRRSVYFFIQSSDLRNPYGGWPTFWMGVRPDNPAPGSYGIINTLPKVAQPQKGGQATFTKPMPRAFKARQNRNLPFYDTIFVCRGQLA